MEAHSKVTNKDKQHRTLICIRRGTQSELFDCQLEIGELGFTTDTHKLFIGSSIGNLQLAVGKPVKKTPNKNNNRHKKCTELSSGI